MQWNPKHLIAIPLAGAVLLAASLFLPAAAQLCSSYRQVSSNAGDCPSCTVRVLEGGGQTYDVVGSNGWRARLTWVDTDGFEALGQGSWANGQAFSMRIRRESSDRATLYMNMDDGSVNAEAHLRCTGGP